MMKKGLFVLLAVVMLFTFVGCSNNDENNSNVQVKMDEAEALVLEIYSWYEDNGLLEGEYEAEFKPILDGYVGGMEETKTYHQQIIDGKGYNDEQTATMIEALDSDIATYKEALATLE